MSRDASGNTVVASAVRPRWRRPLLLMLAVVAVLVLGATAWVGIRAALTAGALSGIEQSVDALSDDAKGENPAADADGAAWATLASLAPRVPELAAEARRAEALVGDPVWMAAEAIPLLGDNLRALRVLAQETDALLAGAAMGLVDTLAAERDTLVRAQTVDLASLARLVAALDEAGVLVDASAARLAELDDTDLDGVLPATAEAATRLSDLATAAAAAFGPARALAAEASVLLGSEGPRDYLVMFLTPAELRASGGLPGAAAAFRVDGGVISRGDIYSTRDYSPAPRQPVLALTDTELALYGDRPARLIQDTTATEDFSRAALFAGALTQLHHGFTPSGVVAVDVVALGYLLDAIGPVTIADGEILSGANASDLLMNEAYIRYPEPRDQDVFFADVAARVLDAALGGELDPVAVGGALVRAAQEGRVLGWSAVEPVQEALDALATTGTTGTTGPDDEPRSALGLYLNDRTSAKMDYYLEASADVVWAVCDDASRLDQVRARLTNKVDPAIVPGLPWYITGGGINVPEGVISTQIVAVGPVGSTVSSWTGGAPDTVVVDESGRPRVAWIADLAPGEDAVRTVVFASAGGPEAAPVLDATPAAATEVRESSGTLRETCGIGG